MKFTFISDSFPTLYNILLLLVIMLNYKNIEHSQINGLKKKAHRLDTSNFLIMKTQHFNCQENMWFLSGATATSDFLFLLDSICILR